MCLQKYDKRLISQFIHSSHLRTMKKQLLILAVLLGSQLALTQEITILPFQGIKVTSHGISFESISATLEDETWTSNVLPRNTSFRMVMKKPVGFTIYQDSNVHPGISVLLTTLKGDTLGYSGNLFGDDFEGIPADYFSSLSVKLGFSDDVLPGDTILSKIVYFDKLSDKSVSLDGQFIIAKDNTPLDQTNSTYGYQSSDGFEGKASGVEMNKMSILVDEISRPTQTIIGMEFFTKGLYALDLSRQDVEIIVFHKDGSTSSNYSYGNYITEQETLSGDDKTNVKNTIQLFLANDVFKTVDAVWMRLRSVRGEWVIAGSIVFNP